jgi:hypothetical protein
MSVNNIETQRTQKAQQGIFFISLSLGATCVILAMLALLLGLMVYRGASRLFFSKVYEIAYAMKILNFR